jgi:hypothetical protein
VRRTLLSASKLEGHMRSAQRVLAACALITVASAAAGQSRWDPVPPLKNPALLNVGFVCRWQQSCITTQMRAMRRSLTYVNSRKVPAWKVQLCNRNAARNGTRKDWVGFNRCVKNPALRRKPRLT